MPGEDNRIRLQIRCPEYFSRQYKIELGETVRKETKGK